VTVPTVDNYFTDLATTVCARFQTCCGLTTPQFNSALCYSTFSVPAYGGWLGTGYVVPYENGPGITYNQSSACSCLEGASTITCDLIPSSTYDSLTSTCLAAFGPTVQLGYPCASSYECVSGAYCTVTDPSDPTDAALGTCAVLKSIGDSCTANDQCSYISAGSPSAYCASGHCATTLAAGATCTANADCASNICKNESGSVTCQSGEVFSDPLGSGGVCDYFTVPDSGAL
jgi:hypothetical protein